MKDRAIVAAGTLAALIALTVASAPLPAQPHAPLARATQRAPAVPARVPASMAEVTIPSHGARLNGIVYLAAGAGSHPVAIFLHGYPGNEKNLDIAQAVRRVGYQALYADYRGTWGSGGSFSFANGLEDAKAMLSWVRDPANAEKYHLDTAHIALIGHSFGGWLALMTAGDEPASVCVAGLAAWNVGWAGERFAAHADERASNLADFRSSTDSASGPVRANADDLMNELSTHGTAWNYLSRARELGKHALLLVSATHDTPDEGVAMHREIANAVRRAGGHHVQLAEYDDDHPFSSHRIALADLVTRWLTTDCATSQTAR